MRRPLLLLLWLLTDVLLFLAAYVLAYFLRVGWLFSTDLPFSQYLRAVILVAPLWLLSLSTTRTFALTRSQTNLRSGAYIAYSCVVGAALLALAYFFLHQRVFSRLLLVTGLGISIVLVWGWHVLFDQIQRFFLRRSPPAFPTLIVGVTRESRKLLELLESRRSVLRPVAILDGRGTPEKEIAGVPVAGKLNKLEETITKHGITHLIQCSDLEQSINLLGICRTHGITYMLLPSVLGIVERDERIESLEGRPVTIVRPEKKG